jgi:hypothetical protein
LQLIFIYVVLQWSFRLSINIKLRNRAITTCICFINQWFLPYYGSCIQRRELKCPVPLQIVSELTFPAKSGEREALHLVMSTRIANTKLCRIPWQNKPARSL